MKNSMSSLENLCLDVIIEKFELLYIAFSVSNNEIFKRNFEILKRKYSFEIISELFKKGKLKKEFLDIFLNEHLKILHCKWFEDKPWKYSLEDVLRRLPNLTEISCSRCTDETLENIAKFCPKIIEIDSLPSFFTNKGIEYLCRDENGRVPCPALKRIFINSHMVTEDCWRYLLQSLPMLEACCFNIPDVLYSLHNEDLLNLENVRSYNFVRLDMSDYQRRFPDYPDLLKLCLSVCPRLKWLRCDITEKEQLNWFKSTDLEYLDVNFLHTGEKLNIDNLLKRCGSHLTALHTENCILSVSKLAVSCPKLENLDVRKVSFLDDSDDPKIHFPHLESFCIYDITENNSSTNEALRLLLICSPMLQHIFFHECFLSPDTKTIILKCCETRELKKIYFFRPEVNIDFMKDVLSSCSSSPILDLRECDYNYGDIKDLFNFAKILPHKPSVLINGNAPFFLYENLIY